MSSRDAVTGVGSRSLKIGRSSMLPLASSARFGSTFFVLLVHDSKGRGLGEHHMAPASEGGEASDQKRFHTCREESSIHANLSRSQRGAHFNTQETGRIDSLLLGSDFEAKSGEHVDVSRPNKAKGHQWTEISHIVQNSRKSSQNLATLRKFTLYNVKPCYIARIYPQ